MPYNLNSDRTALKCYLADTGLLVSMAFNENALLAKDIHNRILSERIEINEGMLVENVVAQMIRDAGHTPYFYARSDRHDAQSRMEIDFLVDRPTLARRHNVSPVEVKSGHNYTFSSLRKYCARFRQFLSTPYLVHSGDYSEKDGITFVPFYMTPFIVTG